MNPSPQLTTADDRAAGAACRACGINIRTGDAVAMCGACAAPHHRHCWEKTAACASYECAPGNRKGGAAPAQMVADPGMVITLDQINATAPIPPRPAAPRSVPVLAPRSTEHLGPDGKMKLSRSAVASLICAVGGIPFFGLLTGAVAVILGVISLGAITSRKRRGVWLAGTGIILGIVDVIGWAVLLMIFFKGSSMPTVKLPEFQVSTDALKDAPPAIALSLRANVLVSRYDGLGSGVVLAISNGDALILTNRHVASPRSTDEGAEVTVQFIEGQKTQGKVVWNAPEGMDASLVRAPVGAGAVVAAIDPSVSLKIGDDVFAVGNPLGLGWTHTKGAISQFRERKAPGSIAVHMIQTTAPINPGNSGGGLYTAAGSLIGINTYSGSKRESEALGFAITYDSIRAAMPQWALNDIAAAHKSDAAKKPAESNSGGAK